MAINSGNKFLDFYKIKYNNIKNNKSLKDNDSH